MSWNDSLCEAPLAGNRTKPVSFVRLIANSGYNISNIHLERISAMWQIKLLTYKKVASSVQKAEQQLEIKVNSNTPWPKATRN